MLHIEQKKIRYENACEHIFYNEVDIGYIELGAPTISTDMHGLGAAIEMLIGHDRDVEPRMERATPDTFRNCFQRTGFTTKNIQSAGPDQDGTIGELREELANVPHAVPEAVSFEDLLSVNDDFAVTVSPSGFMAAISVADVRAPDAD